MTGPQLLHTTVEGRSATVAYFDQDFVFTTRDKATLAKIIFDDTGERVFATMSSKANDWLAVDSKRIDADPLAAQAWRKYAEDYRRARDFNPDQAREPAGSSTGGQFASAGGGGTSAATGTVTEASAHAAVTQAIKHANSGVSDKATYDKLREQSYRPELESEALRGKDTQQANQVNGQYTPARQEIHDKIVKDVLGPERPSDPNRVVIFQGGGAASGKTEAVGAELQRKYPGIAVSDPDIVKFGSHGKGGLPEAETLKKSDPLGAAARLHEESSDISKQIQTEALRRNQSIIIDGVGGNPDKIEKQMALFRARGYRVEVHYADRDTNHALAQMATRYEKTGRWVPPDVLVDGHQKAANAYWKVAPKADEADLRFSKERTGALSETKYELVHEQGKGYNRVVNSALYEQHRRKGG